MDLGVGVLGGFDRSSDELGLLLRPGDERRLVAAADVEASIRSEPASDVAHLDAPFVALRVDHVDAGWRDRQVVDVAGAGAATVQHDRAIADLLLEARRQTSFAVRTLAERLDVLRLGRERTHHRRDPSPLLVQAFASLRAASLVLGEHAPTGLTDVPRRSRRIVGDA